jgi:hypothetical protein
MFHSDLMIVLHYETGYSKAIVPHKFYHYLGMKKPILVVGEEDGEMASIVREANAGRAVSQTRPNGIFDELLTFYRAWKAEGRISCHGSADIIQRFEVQHLTAKLAEAISHTIRRRGLQR